MSGPHPRLSRPTTQETLLRRSAEYWNELWKTPSADMMHAGAAGELLVARTRLLLTGLVLCIPLADLVIPPRSAETLIGIAAAAVAVAIALLAYRLARRSAYQPWIGFATSVTDVSLVSATLAAMLLSGDPVAALNSRVVYEIYLLALAATTLRFDPRVCQVTGAVAVAQYAAVIGLAVWRFDLDVASPYGAVSWGDQVARLMLLGIVAMLGAVVVERSRQLQRSGGRDRLTGLYNRWLLDDLFAVEASRAKRHGRPLSVLMIDVDHFKQLNDTYGHLQGDAALLAVASAIRRNVRALETVARYGGEEFVVLLPETTHAVALQRAEAIRTAVEKSLLETRGGSDAIALTVSIGVATLPVDGSDPQRVLEMADERLYAAKHAGRNRVTGAMGGLEGGAASA
jgi:diguanylate cyclase (GGDEF)-like protein